MQVFKKIYILAVVAFLASCRSPMVTSTSNFSDSTTEINEEIFATKSSFRVGVLLPLSGNAAGVGQGLKNATMLALEDINNSDLILQFYDTQSSPEGARVAVENAINQRVKMIVGPLMSSEVEAISYQTRKHNIPVVAFSTNDAVLQPQVYTMGLLIEEQITRIISYASEKGRHRFALLLPDNETGVAVAKSAVKAAKKYGGTVSRIAFYPPNTTDFSTIIRKMSDYDHRSSSLNKEKSRLSALAENGDEDAKKALHRLKLKEANKGLDFDAIIVPESGSRLKSAVAMFGYYDVFAPDVMFLGTSVWENTNLNKETTLNRAIYPILSRNHSDYFNKKYQSAYGNYPNSLFALAYDAVALSSAIAKRNPSDIDEAITSPDGFIGINGAFRIFTNGKNQHSLDIMQVTPTSDIIVDSAPRKFTSGQETLDGIDAASLYDSNTPLIFGKNKDEAESQIFGRPLGGYTGDSATYQY